MNYFETKSRLEQLNEFRELYREFLNFSERYYYPPAVITMEKMRSLVSQVIQSLISIGYGERMIRKEKKFDGKKIRINIFKAIFRERLQRRYALDEEIPLKVLDSAIAKYQGILWRQKIQLFNPVFWIFHIADYFLRLPFMIIRNSGINYKFEKSAIFQIYLASGHLALFAYLLKISGLLTWLDRDILAVIIGLYK